MRANAIVAWVCVCVAAAGVGCSVGQAPVWSSHPPSPGTGPATTGPGPEALEAAFEHALALAAELDYAPAADAFANLAPPFVAAGNGTRAAECLFWQGFCLEKLGRPAEAAACYRRVIARHGRAQVALQARARLSRMQAALAP